MARKKKLPDGVGPFDYAPKDRENYVFTNSPTGFTITRSDRPTVTVRLNMATYMFELTSDNLSRDGLRNRHFMRVAPYNFFELIHSVANLLMANWAKDQKGSGENFPPAKLTQWAIEQTAHGLNKRVHAEWQRLLMIIPERTRLLAKALYSATQQYTTILASPQIEKYPNVIKDILQYPAAASAFYRFLEIYVPNERRDFLPVDTDRSLALNTFRSDKTDVSRLTQEDQRAYAEWVDEYLEWFSHWRDHLSPTGKAYHALNVTLDHAKRIPSVLLVSRLPSIKLKKPLTERWQVIAVLSAFRNLYDVNDFDPLNGLDPENVPNERNIRRKEVLAHNANLFYHATRKQMHAVIKRINRYRHWDVTLRKMSDIQRVVMFLLDYPEKHNGNIVGLSERSIEYHRHIKERRLEAYRAHILDAKKSFVNKVNAVPPIPLPEIEGIQFLATVDDLFAESERMAHCVYDYDHLTTNGYAFIFHIEYQGEMATIQLNMQGQIVQIAGYDNELMTEDGKPNPAIQWGKQQLYKWAKPWRELVQKKPLNRKRHYDYADHDAVAEIF